MTDADDGYRDRMEYLRTLLESAREVILVERCDAQGA